jgi:benzoyl-CoA reductase/2-hydroxyglutaryl-CoA dehydratase subunit BcrC/BadD/HgdB
MRMGSDPWSIFEDLASDFSGWARAWKERTGKKVIGHLLPDVPEELIHASGAMPLALEGASVSVGRAQEAMPGYTCSHALGILELGLSGELDFLDGLIIPYVCDTTRNLYHTWSNRFPSKAHYFLRLPKRIDHPGAREYLREELKRLAGFLGGVTGNTPTEEDLEKSLALYSESRKILRRAYSLHRERPTTWTLRRLSSLLASAMRSPREEHLLWMRSLPWEEPGSPCSHGERVPIYLRGKVWNPPQVVDALDELGFTVVGDELVVGLRSILDGGEEGEDPWGRLVSRFFSLPLYPGYHKEPKAAMDEFLSRVKRTGASGVIFLNPKFCEAAWFDTPDFQKALEKEGIPSLVLEGSARGLSMGQIRVRLEAFRETFGGELP